MQALVSLLFGTGAPRPCPLPPGPIVKSSDSSHILTYQSPSSFLTLHSPPRFRAQHIPLSSPALALHLNKTYVLCALQSGLCLLAHPRHLHPDPAPVLLASEGGFWKHANVTSVALLGDRHALIATHSPAKLVLLALPGGAVLRALDLPHNALRIFATPANCLVALSDGSLCEVSPFALQLVDSNVLCGPPFVAGAVSPHGLCALWNSDSGVVLAQLSLPRSRHAPPPAYDPSSGLRVVETKATQMSGRYQVSDVDCKTDRTIPPGFVHRQLVFVDTDPDSVQSECRLAGKGEVRACVRAWVGARRERGLTRWQPDVGHLVFLVHRAMLVPLQVRAAERVRRLVVVGLGGGALASYLHALYPAAMVEAIELDGEVVDLAHRMFGLPRNASHLRTHVGDGLKWLRECAQRDCDAVFIDVDAKASSEQAHFPPLDFVDPALLRHVRDEVLASDGILAVNVASRSSEVVARHRPSTDPSALPRPDASSAGASRSCSGSW
jgi:hypothetical protein